jgi:glycosyltransferase involved in cell wall biosynthesis
MARIWVNARFLTQPLTGVQRYAYEVTRRLAGVELICPQPHSPEYDGIAASHAVHLSRFHLGRYRLGGHTWEQFALPLELPRGSLLFSPGNCGPLAVRRQVLTIHDVAPLDHPQWFSRRFSLWYGALLPRLARRVKLILTDSRFSRQRIIERTGVHEDKVVSIPLGVEPRFCPLPEDTLRQVLRQYPIGGPYVLAVSALSSRKNVARLLEAWQRLGHKAEGFSLVVAGDLGLAFSDLSGCAALPSSVVHLGRVRDEHLPALYNGATGFVYPSLYEGFGLPPLEAMACGTPVVASNSTSLPEAVGDAALLVDPLSVESMADGLGRLVHDSILRQSLRAKGLEHVRQFNWDKTAEQTRRALEQAI